MADTPTYYLTRLIFQRGLAIIYLIGFLIAAFQFRGLCGEKGLLPAPFFLSRVGFWDSPSIFHLYYSDRLMLAVAWIGVALSALALSGYSDAYGLGPSIAVWAVLWALYLSFVNIGQTFYGFGWETLLLETGFLAIFLGPAKSAPPVIVIWLLRWVLFRLMFGAGLIKLRGDECWRDLTCLKYHWETQPSPNPLSWFFNLFPTRVDQGAVLFNHLVEVVVPFFYFGPRLFRHTAGVLTIAFQTILILSGNLSWLNHITIVLAFACFDDSFWKAFLPLEAGAGGAAGIPALAIYALTALVGVLSIRPTLNLFSSGQVMNTSFDSFHLVNTYGAFGSITRERYEVVLEGTDDASPSPKTAWKEYLFKAKPSEVDRLPPQVSPYHYKLDWQMWFAAMGPYYYHPWILSLVGRLLEGSPEISGLLRLDPFAGGKPRFIRAQLYRYQFTRPGESRSGWWKRELVGEYLPPLSLEQPEFRRVLEKQGWL